MQGVVSVANQTKMMPMGMKKANAKRNKSKAIWSEQVAAKASGVQGLKSEESGEVLAYPVVDSSCLWNNDG